jgi:cytoskeletal protein CcmA (bactofilin family)
MGLYLIFFHTLASEELINNFKKNTIMATPTNNSSTTETGLTCIIAKGTVITGKITTTENIRLDGIVNGEVHCDKRLVMDAGGKIKGDVYAMSSTIKGEVEGTVTISDTLHLQDSSYIKGTIKAKQLRVEEGAKYEGNCIIG